MSPNPPNLPVLVQALTAEDVRFVFIGRFAGVLHDRRPSTMHSDFAISPDPDNLSSVIRAFHGEPLYKGLK